MKLEELKTGIDQSSPEDRVFLAAYLRHVVRSDDPAYKTELARRRDEMNAGKRFSLEQLKRVDQALDAEGL